MPLIGPQEYEKFFLQGSQSPAGVLTYATTDGSGQEVSVGSYNGNQKVTVVNLGTGTCTLNIEGSDGDVDGSGNVIWYPVAYIKLADNTGVNATRSVLFTPPGVAASSWAVYEVQDLYGTLRARISNTAGTTQVLAHVTCVPV